MSAADLSNSAFRLDSSNESITNRFESIRFPKTSDRSIRAQLVGVYMQSLPTMTVYTLYISIIHLVLFHSSVRTAVTDRSKHQY